MNDTACAPVLLDLTGEQVTLPSSFCLWGKSYLFSQALTLFAVNLSHVTAHIILLTALYIALRLYLFIINY